MQVTGYVVVQSGCIPRTHIVIRSEDVQKRLWQRALISQNVFSAHIAGRLKALTQISTQIFEASDVMKKFENKKIFILKV